jgi:hypothetical protein
MEGRTDMTQQIVAIRNFAKEAKNVEASVYLVPYGNKTIFAHPSQTNMTVNVEFALPFRGFTFPQTTKENSEWF